MRVCKFLLDTSALLLTSEGLDLGIKIGEDLDCDKVELYTLSNVIRELESLASSRSLKKAPPARHALNYVKEHVSILTVDDPSALGDEAIIKHAVNNPDFIVVTLDRRLRELLKSAGVRAATWWFSKRRFSIA